MSAQAKLAVAALAAALQLAASATPNILFIVADDLGWHDVGISGSGIDTPDLDNIFYRGVRIEDAYVMPVCSPSRAAILTGRFPIACELRCNRRICSSSFHCGP